MLLPGHLCLTPTHREVLGGVWVDGTLLWYGAHMWTMHGHGGTCGVE